MLFLLDSLAFGVWREVSLGAGRIAENGPRETPNAKR
jgi:hypothetical protein